MLILLDPNLFQLLSTLRPLASSIAGSELSHMEAIRKREKQWGHFENR